MAKIFTVYRVVNGQLGSAITHPVKVFESKEVAQDGLRLAAEPLSAIIESGKVLIQTPAGPRMVMTVQQLLVELGIEGLSHAIVPSETHASAIVTPTSAIIQ